jgi:DNA-binding NtrC family response regulator
MPVNNKLIFIISELSALALSVKKQCEAAGHRGVPFYDAMSGIKQSIQEKPDVVVADFQFNNVMGLEVIQQIKIKYPDIKSILLVNSETHPDVKKATELGCGILKKPIDFAKFNQLLNDEKTGAAKASGTKNVMIVERSANIRFAVKKAVGTVPCEFVEAQNPYEFLEKSFTRNWDLIIIDVDNDYMSADEFLKLAVERKIDPWRTVLLATQWDNFKQDKFVAKGFTHFAKIPIEQQALVNVVGAILTHG